MKVSTYVKDKPAIIGRPSADEVRFQETAAKETFIMHYVYILLCFDKKQYIGCTNDLKDRKFRHDNGRVAATAKRLPVKLIAYFAFSNRYTAFSFEKYLKSGSGRAFIKKHFFEG